MKYLLNPYLITLRTNHGELWYNPLNQKIILLTNSDIRKIKANHIDKNLTDLLFFIKSKNTETQEELQDRIANILVSAFNLKPDIEVLYLILTEKCNLRCKYCFVERGDISTHFMSEKIIEQSLRLFAELAKNSERPVICPYGGEPLLNARGFSFLLRKVREYKESGILAKNTVISLVTNGTLVKKNINLLNNPDLDLAISLDGPPKVNDKMRVYSNNLGSSKASIGAIRLLNKESIPFGISCTLTPYNTPILSDVASYFIEELKCKRICFNLPITSDIFRLDPYYATLKMIEAYEVIKKSGGTEDRMSRIIRPLINGGFKLYDCAGCGGQIVVTPDAKIGPCQAFLSKKEGHFEDFGLTRKNPKEVAYKILNSELFNRWAQKAAILNKACKYCKFVSLCGGGCPAFVEQNKLQKDVRWCTYVRNATNWILKELAKDSKTEPAKKFEGDINYRPLNPF